MATTLKTISELNQIICDSVGISIEKYNAMSLSEQFKVRTNYVRLKNSNQLTSK